MARKNFRNFAEPFEIENLMSKAKILYVSQEILPFSPESIISRISRNLPQGAHEKNKEIRVFMPRFGKINERRHQLHEVIRLSGMNLIINDTDHPLIIKVASIPSARLQVYFIDNDEYFKRKADLVDDKGALFPDNDERSIFFVRGVLETVKKLGWVPDIIHCHGWMSALMPAYVKEFYKNDPHFANSKVVYSLYGNGFEGSLDKDLKKKLAFDGLTDRALNLIGEPTHTNLTKLAVEYADGVIYGTSNVPDEVKLHAASTETVCIDCVDEDRVVGEITNFYDSILQGNPALVEE